ncbi:MAG: type II toxin-antitoxin system PemK/MazF family toxin [Bryobacteraceae bacterium]
MEVLQGDIYWVRARDLDIEGSEQKNNRPYVIVSRLRINRLGKNVVGVPLSTKLHKACGHRVMIPLQMMVKDLSWPLEWAPGQPRTQLETSVALTDHVRVLDKDRLTQPRMGYLSSTAIVGLELALHYVFESPQNP